MRGIGVLLNDIYGNEKFDSKTIEGHLITHAEIDNNMVKLTLEGGRKLRLWDDQQTCCENRYMSTDDNLDSLVGHRLVAIEVKDGPPGESEYGDHEQEFLEIRTDAGFVTIVNHNEHNGYYGGFSLKIAEEAAI